MTAFPISGRWKETLLSWAVKLSRFSRDLSSLKSIVDYKQTEVAAVTGSGSLAFSISQARLVHALFLDTYVFVWGYAKGTTSGTGAILYFPLPIEAELTEFETPFSCRVYDGSDYAGIAYIESDGGARLLVQRYNAANWGAGAGRKFSFFGCYIKKKRINA